MTGKSVAIPAKVNVNTTADYEENPEWTKEDFARAVPHIGGRPVGEAEFHKAAIKAGHLDAARIGRPRSDNPKQAVNLRLDADVVAHFRSLGPGWQTRINAALRRAARLPKQAKRA